MSVIFTKKNNIFCKIYHNFKVNLLVTLRERVIKSGQEIFFEILPRGNSHGHKLHGGTLHFFVACIFRKIIIIEIGYLNRPAGDRGKLRDSAI